MTRKLFGGMQRIAADRSDGYGGLVMPRENIDPYWHAARLAARIWMKAQRGKALTPRDKRVARTLAGRKGVSNRLIQQEILGRMGGPYREVQTRTGPKQVLHVLKSDEFPEILAREY